MRKSVPGILLIALVAACSTPPAQNQMPQADASVMGRSFPPNSGAWHFSGQSWNNGIHFCEYMSGRNKVISRIESTERCPAEVTAP